MSLSLDPKSPVNQKLLDQVQRSRMIADIFDEWIDSIVQQGTNYIASLIKVYDNAIAVSKELDLEATTWDNEKNKWVAVLAQMNDVQKFGIMKFLAEKPVDNMDDNVLYASKKNVEWRKFNHQTGSWRIHQIIKGIERTHRYDAERFEMHRYTTPEG